MEVRGAIHFLHIEGTLHFHIYEYHLVVGCYPVDTLKKVRMKLSGARQWKSVRGAIYFGHIEGTCIFTSINP